MTERDILFSAPMRAKLLEGAKTQTRRVLAEMGVVCDVVSGGVAYQKGGDGNLSPINCPYGLVGDHLRLRGDPDILLMISGVRAGRLTAINAADAVAEGVEPGGDPIAGYRAIWDGLNAARGFGWENNPWVWVIEFKRLQ